MTQPAALAAFSWQLMTSFLQIINWTGTRNVPCDTNTFKGWEIVDNTARLCASEYVLARHWWDESPIEVYDALLADPGDRFDMVLTNPPFGKKSSVTITTEEGRADKEALTYEREDFWATTSNKQLQFCAAYCHDAQGERTGGSSGAR